MNLVLTLARTVVRGPQKYYIHTVHPTCTQHILEDSNVFRPHNDLHTNWLGLHWLALQKVHSQSVIVSVKSL